MFYIVVEATGDRCGPLDTRDEAHQKGSMWYGTGNFSIEEEKPKQAPKVEKTPEVKPEA